jgi:hypothetical protein
VGKGRLASGTAQRVGPSHREREKKKGEWVTGGPRMVKEFELNQTVSNTIQNRSNLIDPNKTFLHSKNFK